MLLGEKATGEIRSWLLTKKDLNTTKVFERDIFRVAGDVEGAPGQRSTNGTIWAASLIPCVCAKLARRTWTAALWDLHLHE